MRKLLDIVHQLQSGQLDSHQAKDLVLAIGQQRQVDPELAMRAASFVQRQLANEDEGGSAVAKSRIHYLETCARRSAQSTEAASVC